MANGRVDVFHLDDDESTRDLLERQLQKLKVVCYGFPDFNVFDANLSNGRPRVIVMNTSVNYDGVPRNVGQIIPTLRRKSPDTRIVLYSGNDCVGEELAKLHNVPFYCIGVDTPKEVAEGLVGMLRGGENGE